MHKNKPKRLFRKAKGLKKSPEVRSNLDEAFRNLPQVDTQICLFTFMKSQPTREEIHEKDMEMLHQGFKIPRPQVKKWEGCYTKTHGKKILLKKRSFYFYGKKYLLKQMFEKKKKPPFCTRKPQQFTRLRMQR